ncbi:hypothetical protein COCCADRAFT_86048, partial [Bipolaris zeicola 26-R-13]
QASLSHAPHTDARLRHDPPSSSIVPSVKRVVFSNHHTCHRCAVTCTRLHTWFGTYVPIMAFTRSASTMAFWRSCVNTPDAWYAGAETGEETGG